MTKPSFFLFLMFTAIPLRGQPDLIGKIAEVIDTATADRTQELMRASIPSNIEAYHLAFQGIAARDIELLQQQGIDIVKKFENWPMSVEDASIFADCIVVGKVTKLRFVPDARLNKYVNVEVERWLKGSATQTNTIVLRTVGSGPTKDPGIYMRVSHEVKFAKGERVLLLLSKANFLLFSGEQAPFETESYKEDYPMMYMDYYGIKLLIKGDWVVEIVDEREIGREKLNSVVDKILDVAQKVKSIVQKGEEQRK